MARSLAICFCLLLIQCADGQVTVLRWHGEAMHSGTFYPGGNAVVATGDSSIVFWDPESGQELHTVNVRCESMGSAVCSPDGQQLAVGEYAVGLYALLWQNGINGGYRSGTLDALCNGLSALCFSPDGSIIAGTGDLDFGGYLMRTDSLKGLCCTGIGTTTFSHNSQFFAEGYSVWYACMLRETKTQRVLDTIISGAPYFSHDDSRLLISNGDRYSLRLQRILMYDVATHTIVDSFPSSPTTIPLSAFFSPNDSLILSINLDSTLTLWSATSRTPTHVLRVVGTDIDNTSIPQYENCNVCFGA